MRPPGQRAIAALAARCDHGSSLLASAAKVLCARATRTKAKAGRRRTFILTPDVVVTTFRRDPVRSVALNRTSRNRCAVRSTIHLDRRELIYRDRQRLACRYRSDSNAPRLVAHLASL